MEKITLFAVRWDWMAPLRRPREKAPLCEARSGKPLSEIFWEARLTMVRKALRFLSTSLSNERLAFPETNMGIRRYISPANLDVAGLGLQNRQEGLCGVTGLHIHGHLSCIRRRPRPKWDGSARWHPGFGTLHWKETQGLIPILTSKIEHWTIENETGWKLDAASPHQKKRRVFNLWGAQAERALFSFSGNAVQIGWNPLCWETHPILAQGCMIYQRRVWGDLMRTKF